MFLSSTTVEFLIFILTDTLLHFQMNMSGLETD